MNQALKALVPSAIAGLIVVCVELASATDYYVPADASHIGTVLTSTTSGDRVLVAAGFIETEAFTMKIGVSVEAASGSSSNPPKIDPPSTATAAVIFPTGTYNTQTKLVGFTIEGYSTQGVKIEGIAGTGGVLIDACTIDGGSHGVVSVGGDAPLVISNSTIKNGGTAGIALEYATSATVELNYITGNGTAILLDACDPLIQRNTITLNSNGVLRAIAGASPTIKQNVIYDNSGTGVGCFAGNATVFNNDVFDNGTNYGDAGSCADSRYDNVAEDPVFCSGGITVHVASICAPANNSYGVLMGAKGVGCASGDLPTSATLTTSIVDPGGMLVYSDFRIPSGKSLTLDAGVTVTVDDADENNFGSDSSENEIIVRGTLVRTVRVRPGSCSSRARRPREKVTGGASRRRRPTRPRWTSTTPISSMPSMGFTPSD